MSLGHACAIIVAFQNAHSRTYSRCPHGAAGHGPPNAHHLSLTGGSQIGVSVVDDDDMSCAHSFMLRTRVFHITHVCSATPVGRTDEESETRSQPEGGEGVGRISASPDAIYLIVYIDRLYRITLKHI